MRTALFIAIFAAFTSSVEASEPCYEWGGFYLGLISGAEFGRSHNKSGNIGYNADNDTWSYEQSGFNAGAVFGYNHPLHRFILGPELELGYLNMGGSGAQPASPAADTLGKTNSNFYTALRARAGFTLGRTLLFAGGGGIGTIYNTQVVDRCNIAPCGGSTVDASKSAFVFGFTVGGGVERMIEQDWSIKLEYLYVNFASQSFSGTSNLGVVYDWSAQSSGHIIRAGLNYSFY